MRTSVAARLLGLRVRIPPGHGCLSLVNVVCCQVEVSAPGRSLVQRSPTECGVSLIVIRLNINLYTYNGWVEEVKLRKKEGKEGLVN
jgi:hypothetical protein